MAKQEKYWIVVDDEMCPLELDNENILCRGNQISLFTTYSRAKSAKIRSWKWAEKNHLEYWHCEYWTIRQARVI